MQSELQDITTFEVYVESNEVTQQATGNRVYALADNGMVRIMAPFTPQKTGDSDSDNEH